MKYCPKCAKEKPETNFYHDESRMAKNKLGGYCKECRRAASKEYAARHRVKLNRYSKEHYAKNKKLYRDKFLQTKYGINEDRFQQMLRAQEGKCAICQRHHTQCAKGRHSGVRLCVDHDHASGRVRGLLCHSCNHRLDFLSSPKISQRTVSYLQQSTNR